MEKSDIKIRIEIYSYFSGGKASFIYVFDKSINIDNLLSGPNLVVDRFFKFRFLIFKPLSFTKERLFRLVWVTDEIDIDKVRGMTCETVMYEFPGKFSLYPTNELTNLIFKAGKWYSKDTSIKAWFLNKLGISIPKIRVSTIYLKGLCSVRVCGNFPLLVFFSILNKYYGVEDQVFNKQLRRLYKSSLIEEINMRRYNISNIFY